MINSARTYQAVIIGGGAVGLFLGLCLEHLGISCTILEKRKKVREGSRSLGIHPVSLELFAQLGIAGQLIKPGIPIERGHAFANTQKIGTLSFEDCPKPFNYILALPQNQTERILEQELRKTNSEILQRGAKVTSIQQNDQKVTINYTLGDQQYTATGLFAIGCDGKKSRVRQQADIDFKGRAYPDTYIMGDFSDNTQLGSDAAIYLCNEGLIESFPLLNNKRRWVVKTSDYISAIERNHIEQRVWKRIGLDLSRTENIMLSSFGVQKYRAEQIVRHRIILAGDAAHVVSPIGGQGMNLGWLGAWDLAKSLKNVFKTRAKTTQILRQFEQRRVKAAGNAMRRAEINMRLGRKVSLPFLRNNLVSLMLNTPLSHLMAKVFTMRGVEKWIT